MVNFDNENRRLSCVVRQIPLESLYAQGGREGGRVCAWLTSPPSLSFAIEKMDVPSKATSSVTPRQSRN